ncbi:MAG: hypothetical protein LBL16_02200 [Endomicrobium sp.]|jgi:hypothetical protein|nr:hypothetical protein [Endomicrobium sp.]
MDYELGSKDLTWSYWQANENGKPYLSDVEVAQTTEIPDLRHPVFKDKTGNTMSDFIPEIEIEEQIDFGLAVYTFKLHKKESFYKI